MATRPALRRALPKAGAVAAVTLGLSWVAITQGLATAAATSKPEMALSVAPGNVRALEQLIERRTLDSGNTAGFREMAPRARAVLAREPLSAIAARVLALNYDLQGDLPRAERLIDYAAHLTRRDLPTRLYLIERAVGRNEVAGALEQYDIALRTSRVAPQVLFPVLTGALMDPELVEPMSKIARRDPAWFRGFAYEALDQAPDVRNLAELMRRAPETRVAQEADFRRSLLGRLVAGGHYDDAYRYYGLVTGAPGASRLPIRNATFKGQPHAWAFDWVTESEAGLGAELGGDANASGLTWHAAADQGGAVASQLLLLGPGTYEFVSRGTSSQGEATAAPRWQLACEGQSANSLFTLTLPRAEAPIDTRVAFVVPQGCAAQTLKLHIRAASDPGGQEGRIERVAIIRR